MDPERDFTREPVGRFEWERIMRRVVVSKPSVKLVALTLATYADTKTGGRVRPGLERLMGVTGTSRNVVLRALAELKALGMIDQLTRGGNLGRASKGMASVYQLTLPSDLLDCVPMLEVDEREQVPALAPVQAEEAPTAGSVPHKQVPNSTEQVPIGTETGPKTIETGPRAGTLSPQLHPFNESSPQTHLTTAEAPAPSKADAKQQAEDFNAWYAIYPKHVGRGAAVNAYAKARKNGATAEELNEGARRYAAQRKGQDAQYTKQPATWLNQECWTDEPSQTGEKARTLSPWDAGYHRNTVPKQYAWCNEDTEQESA